MEDYLVTFGAVSLVGLLIMILGLRASTTSKRTLETIGAVAFHIGVFGILYHKVDIYLFVSLVALVLSLFVLIDPLKLTAYIQPRLYRTIGLLLLFIAIAFSMMYFTNFPAWLWLIPLAVYVLPLTITPLRRRQTAMQLSAWFIIVIYVCLVGYALYDRLYPGGRYTFLINWFAKPQIEGTATGVTTAPDTTQTVVIPIEDENGQATGENQVTVQKPDTVVTAPATEDVDTTLNSTAPDEFALDTEGPFLKSLKKADEEYLKLKRDYEELRKKYQALEQQHQELVRKTSPAVPPQTTSLPTE